MRGCWLRSDKRCLELVFINFMGLFRAHHCNLGTFYDVQKEGYKESSDDFLAFGAAHNGLA